MTKFKIGERVRLTEAAKTSCGRPPTHIALYGNDDGIVLGPDRLGVAVRWLATNYVHQYPPGLLERAVYWGHAEGEADKYTGMFCTREECIDDGTSEYGGEPFYILSGSAPDPAKVTPRAADIIGSMWEAGTERWGDTLDGEDWPNVAPEALAELDDFLKSWARRHAQPKFWVGVGQPERIEPKETK